MTNIDMLEDKIYESGLKKGYIAAKIGVSASTLSALLNNRTEFKASQIRDICSVLNITDDAEIKAIFFS